MRIHRLSELVGKALDQFDEQELDVTARRALRIAKLRGDTPYAHRLMLELKTSGGPMTDTYRSLQDLYPELEHQDVSEEHRTIVDEFIEGRLASEPGKTRPGDDDRSVIGGSIRELHLRLEDAVESRQGLLAVSNYETASEVQEVLSHRVQILERIRAWIFGYLIRVETQLEASDTVSAILARHRHAVDELLEREAPDLRDKLAAALRTAQASDDPESRSQVLTTCRRVIEAVADHLYPAATEPHTSPDGTEHAVGQMNYRNRIVAHFEDGSTAEGAFGSAINDLAARLDGLDALAQKGVHEEVTVAEMEFGLAQTYLLAGELLADRLGKASS